MLWLCYIILILLLICLSVKLYLRDWEEMCPSCLEKALFDLLIDHNYQVANHAMLRMYYKLHQDRHEYSCLWLK